MGVKTGIELGVKTSDCSHPTQRRQSLWLIRCQYLLIQLAKLVLFFHISKFLSQNIVFRSSSFVVEKKSRTFALEIINTC
jgi:hypothetical protein